MTFRQKCLNAGIDYNKARYYKDKHKELSDEQVIQYYLTPKQKSFTERNF